MGWVVSTLGAGIVLQALATLIWGTQAMAFPPFLYESTDYLTLFGVQVSMQLVLVCVAALAVMLVLGTLLPAIFASTLVLFGDHTERELFRWVGVLASDAQLKGWMLLISTIIRYFVELAAVVLVMAVMYYFGPNRKQSWNDVLPGALLATTLWLLTTQVFAWYVRNLAQYNLLYGSIGGVIAMLVWIYLLSAIALLGCEFNAEREKLLKVHSVD